MKRWLIIGIIIRLAIIPLTYHSDTRFFAFTNYLLVYQQLWLSFYDFLSSAPQIWTQVFPPESLTYPPLAILSGGLFAQLTYRLISLDYIRNFLLNTQHYLYQPNFYWLLFLTKLPYLIVDLVTGYFLSQLVPDKQRFTAFKLWMVNPITLYATFAIGEFDIYPTFLAILAVWFIQQHKKYPAAVALGLGGAFKLFPLLFLPFLILNYGRSIKEKILMSMAGISGYLVPLIPYLPSPGFRSYALLAPQADKLLFAKIPVTGAEYLSIFFVAYLLIILFSYQRRLTLWKSMTATLFLFFGVTHFHPQWFIWISPWLILLYLESPALKYYLVGLLALYLIIVLSFESSLNWGIFVFNLQAPNLTTYLPPSLDVFKYLSIIRSLFAGLSFYLIYKLFSRLTYKQALRK